MLVEYMQGIGSLFLLAIALGLDGFSVSLGYGMQRIRLRHVFIIGLMIGLFHVLLPLLGILIGHYVSSKLEFFALVLSGALLVAVGAYMIFSSFQKQTGPRIIPAGMKLVSVAFAVSIDSFPVGISLGLVSLQAIGVVFVIGSVTMALSWLGILIGRKVQGVLGLYSEVLGGAILFFMGIHLLFYT